MKTFKTRFYPTKSEAEYIRKACGIRRWTWNWAVATFFEAAKQDKFPTTFDLQKQLNNTLVLQKEYSWLTEVNSMVRGEALKDFGLAIKAYAKARHVAKRTVEKQDIDKFKPHFKKKGKCTESFRMFKKSGSDFKVHSAHDISVTTTRGHKHLHIHPVESVEFLKDADIKTCTFSVVADAYYISVSYEKTNRAKTANAGTLGIDLGIKTSVSCFDGTNSFEFGLPDTLRAAQKRTERLNKKFSRTQKGSKRHQKALLQVQKAYQHEANIKRDFREKLTTKLADSYSTFKVDDFDFQGSLNLKYTARKLYNVSPYAFKLRLEQKAAERGSTVFYLPKFTPSTKTCSCCGSQKMMKLSDRVYDCPVCGLHIDRDANSAIFAYNY